QGGDRVRRVAVMMAYAESDPQGQLLLRTFAGALEKLGWKPNSNLIMETRWAGGDVNRMRMFAKELVSLQPDGILANTTPDVAAFQRETKTIPIVFVVVSDPVGDGFVTSLSRPGGNITGFLHLEGSVGGKWLELLEEIAPQVRRAAIMFNPDTAPGHGRYYSASFEAAAKALSIQPLEGSRKKRQRHRGGRRLARRSTKRRASGNERRLCPGPPPHDHRRDRSLQDSCGVSVARQRHRRGFAGLWSPLCGPVQPGSDLCRSHSPGRELCRVAGAGTDQVR